MSLLLLLPHSGVANYVLTAQGGVYNVTGASATITRTVNSPIVQTAYNAEDSGSASTTIAVTLTGVTAGNCIIVYVGWGSSASETATVAFTGGGGLTYTEIRDATNNQSGMLAHKENCPSGSNTVTATFSGAVPYRRIRIAEVSGIASSSAFDTYIGQAQSGVGTGTDSISSGTSAATSNANDYIFGFCQDIGNSDPGSGTMAAGTGYTLEGSNQILPLEWKSVSATGTQTATFTDSKNSDRITFVMALKKAAASGYTLTAQGGSYSLAGGSASLLRSKKIVSTGGSYALTGASAILKRSKYILASGGSYALTGASAVLQKNLNWKLTANGGTYSITGASVNLLKSKKIVATGGTYSLTGGSAIISRNRKLTASGGSYSLTGASAVLTWTPGATGYTLTCLGGSYSLTGSSALFSRNRKLTANGGSYQQIGSNATLLRSKLIVSSGGTYTLSGGTATLLRSKRIVASGGSYSLTGQPATILKSKYLLTTGGSYTITGQQATITWTSGPNAYTLICNGGAYTLTGSQASISRNRKLTASGGSYTYTGQSATILRTKYLSASGGSYVINGQAATLKKSYILQAAGGLYQLTGSSAILQKAGSLVWPLPSQVLLGVEYGPTGIEYTGTLNIFGIKYDITTGKLIKPLTEKVVMTL